MITEAHVDVRLSQLPVKNTYSVKPVQRKEKLNGNIKVQQKYM